MDMGVEEEEAGDEQDPSYEVHFDDKPAESAPIASDHRAAPSNYFYTPSHTSSNILTHNHSTHG